MKFGAISLRRATLLLSTATVVGLTGLSTGASALTLQEAVGLVISTNPEVGVTVKDRRAIDFELRQARALYYPQIDVRLDAGINFSESETTDVANDRTNQGVHDHGRWLYGQRDAQVTLQQRIFDGFETDSEVERQKSRIESAGHRIQDQGQVSALDATQSYLDVMRHTERVTNAEANVAAHEDTLGLVQRRAELGGGNVADVRQAEARLATARTNLEEIQGDLRDARAVFQRVVGVEPQDLEPVVLDGAMIAATEEESVARALQTNPKILLAQADVDVAGHEIDKEAAPLYPRLDLEVIGNNNRHNNGKEDTTYSATFLLVARYNLYRGGADLARVREFKWRKAEAQERLRVEERGVAEDVRLSWSARDTQRNSVATLQDQVEANQNTRDVYAQQFDIGQRSLLDLLDATNELFLSKNDLITAQYEELFANYRILASQGELVQAMGVAFPKEATPGEVDDFETVAPGDPAN
jgi:adhesin transport system outer membrane protein